MRDISPEKAVSKYFDRVEARQSPNTLKNKRTSIYGFQEWLSERGMSLWSVSEEVIEDYIDYLLNDDYGKRSVRVKCYDISAFYGFCVDKSFTGNNPVEEVDLKWLKGNKIDEYTTERYISKEEYKKLLSVEMSPRDSIAIRLLWETGVRASEAVSIRLDDFNYDERYIYVLNAKQKENKRRKVYFTRSFERYAKKWVNGGQRDAHLGAGSSPYFLVSKNEEQMHSNRLNEIVRERSWDAGIQDDLYEDQSGVTRHKVTAHSMRHSYAVHRVKSGMNLKFLSILMGHSSTDVTADKYLQFKDDDIKEADKKYRP